MLVVPAARGLAQSGRAEALAEQLRRYIDQYELTLSTLVADGAFAQTISYSRLRLQRRHLVSDFGFLPLPGNLGWLGQRSVRFVDGEPVGPDIARLDDVFARAGSAIHAQARAVAAGNERFNLGPPRTMNVPTLPLELLLRRHAHRFRVTHEGDEQRGGRPVARLYFREQPPGAIIAHDARRFVRTDVRVWMAVDDGALLRADVTLHSPRRWNSPHRVRVDFELEPVLGVLVPVRLSESFVAGGQGSGDATYRNFRRFQGSGRILPPRSVTF
jgi:hypothetical protein